MTGQAERPLLFLDVDGPLLPFGEDPQHTRRHATPDSRLSRLSPRLGLRLAALPCELVWATTWEDDANAEVAPRLGLPTLPVVNWPESSGHEREDIWLGLCWKTRTLVDWADGRPFVWVDDELGLRQKSKTCTASSRSWASRGSIPDGRSCSQDQKRHLARRKSSFPMRSRT